MTDYGNRPLRRGCGHMHALLVVKAWYHFCLPSLQEPLQLCLHCTNSFCERCMLMLSSIYNQHGLSALPHRRAVNIMSLPTCKGAGRLHCRSNLASRHPCSLHTLTVRYATRTHRLTYPRRHQYRNLLITDSICAVHIAGNPSHAVHHYACAQQGSKLQSVNANTQRYVLRKAVQNKKCSLVARCGHDSRCCRVALGSICTSSIPHSLNSTMEVPCIYASGLRGRHSSMVSANQQSMLLGFSWWVCRQHACSVQNT